MVRGLISLEREQAFQSSLCRMTASLSKMDTKAAESLGRINNVLLPSLAAVAWATSLGVHRLFPALVHPLMSSQLMTIYNIVQWALTFCSVVNGVAMYQVRDTKRPTVFPFLAATIFLQNQVMSATTV